MYIIVGLGNPTSKYDKTRHNVGFDTIDALADKYSINVNNAKHKALCGQGIIEGEKVLLMKPQTFMNLSGESVRDVLNYYKVDPQDELIVVYDDISLPLGKIRIRAKGSAGGHNGIKSIIECLGTDEFKRIKIGVGKKPHPEMVLADWVLSHFTQDEMKALESRFDDVAEALTLMNKGDVDKAMNNFNS